MIHRFAVAIGAGCAAAFLFAVSAQTSALAMLLAYLAPLPLMIATLGWGVDAGVVAAAASVAGLIVLADPFSNFRYAATTGLLFAASVATPAWLLAAFAAAPIERFLPAKWRRGASHASVGAIVSLAAAIGMLGAAATLTTLIVVYGGYAEGVKRATATLIALASDALEGADSGETRALADSLVRFGPAAIAASTLLMLSVNLYAAARSTELSHRLRRPWPDLPTSLHLPWPLGVVAIVSAIGAYAFPAPASQYFGIGVGGLGGALALQGLAVAHALSRGLRARILMLIALYACCVLRAKFTLPALAVLGIVDAFVRLRTRAALLATPKPTSQR